MTAGRGQGAEAQRPLLWWSERELGALRAQLEERLVRFGRDWGLDVAVSTLANACEAELPAALRDAGAWVGAAAVHPAAKGMWIGGSDAPSALIERALFGDSPLAASRGHEGDVSLAGAVAVQAWQGLCAALAGADARQDSSAETGAVPTSAGVFPARQQLPWSGAIRGVIQLDGAASASLGWHLEPVRAREWMGARSAAGTSAQRAALTPVLEAMRRRPIGLAARLADIELDLGTLLTLQPGDVITVGHALDRPVQLYLRDAASAGTPLAAGHLGQLGEAKAIQLLPHAPATPMPAPTPAPTSTPTPTPPPTAAYSRA